jgi:MFS family permease
MKSAIYRYYVLGLLMLIYAFNFLDRQVVTIIAPYLKADMGVTDAQLGLLFGTAFALFYAVFGLPLGKLADGWNRVKTIGVGLTFWSAMTAISGLAGNFAQLGLARIGVGIGESSASPASYSLLQDYFPKEKRATALALYSSGIYIGAGAALVFGGEIAKYWDANYTAATAPFGLSGWQATYFAFGIPGILLAILLMLTVREPVRGEIDGLPTPGDPNPVRSVMREFGAMLPPWNWRGLAGTASVRNNLVMLAVIAVVALITIWITDGLLPPAKRAVIGLGLTTNMVQWIAIGIGVYCVGSWLQTIKQRDPPSYALIANRGFIGLTVAGGLMSYISYGLSPFIFLFAKEQLGAGPEAGLTLGFITAIFGGFGAAMGGVIGDWLKLRTPAGRIYVMLFALAASVLFVILSFTATDKSSFFIYSALQISLHIMWLGPCAASIQDLVLPRMRGTATAAFFLGTTILGLGLGPYLTGLVSDVSGNLRFSLISTVAVAPIILIACLIALRSVPRLAETVVERARVAGEVIA